MSESVRILGIAGSLRKESYNRAALRAAQGLVPADATLDAFELEGIPLFNQDHEKSLPPRVAELKAKVRAADAVLIVTPEYNYSIPGVLKNAIDWASRPSATTRGTASRWRSWARRWARWARRARSITCANLRLSQHAPGEQAGGHDLDGRAALRRRTATSPTRRRASSSASC